MLTVEALVPIHAHIPVLLVQSNELPENMCPVKALWDYLQIRGHETKKEHPLFLFMNNGLS
jgi:hypothetical protein